MKDREILESLLLHSESTLLDDEAQAISNILKENENLKQASIINDRLYQEVCNKNKELEEVVEKLKGR